MHGMGRTDAERVYNRLVVISSPHAMSVNVSPYSTTEGLFHRRRSIAMFAPPKSSSAPLVLLLLAAAVSSLLAASSVVSGSPAPQGGENEVML